jgi:hypothetical protein
MEDSQEQEKYSPINIQEWQQRKQEWTAKHRGSTHSLKSRDGIGVRRGGEPNTGKALTCWNSGMLAE